MNILFVNRVMGIWRGGGETVDLNIATAFKKMSHNVTFITGCLNCRKIPHPIQNFETHYIQTPYLPSLLPNLMKNLPLMGKIGLIDTYIWEKSVYHFLIDKNILNNIDALWTLSLPVLTLRIFTRTQIPSLVRFPGPPDKLLKKTISKLPAIIANGHAFLYIQKNFGDKNLNYVNVGFTAHENNSHNFQLKGISSKNEFIILYVGRLVAIKNIELLIKVMAKLRHLRIKLIIIGDGPEKNKLIKLAVNLNCIDKIVFTGQIPLENVHLYYKKADIFVLSSRYDNFPNVLVEAMGYGLPVISTKVGGIPLLIENNVNGSLIEDNNVDQLACEIVKYLNDPLLRRRIGEFNLNYIKNNFNWEKSAIKIQTIIENLRKH